MKKNILYTAVAVALLCSGFAFVSKNKAIFENDGDDKDGNTPGFFAFWSKLKANPTTGVFSINDFYAASEQLEQMPQSKAAGLQWNDVGPHNVGGRTRALLIDKNNTQHMFAGGVSGGLYESTNAGVTWNIWHGVDSLPNINISCLAQAANGDIYFGTGEQIPAYSSANLTLNFPGAGVFKSTDGGVNFKQIKITKPSAINQSTNFSYITAIACDPTNADKVYLATNSGLYVSENATKNPSISGTSFTDANNIFFGKRTGATGAGTCYDVKAATNGDIVATAIGSSVSSVIVSTDGGVTFQSHPINIPNTQYEEVQIAISPVDKNYIYLITLKSGVSGGIFRSTDEGTTFTTITPAASSTSGFNPYGNQGYYDMCIAASINDKDKFFIGGNSDIYTWELSNGWTRIASGYNASSQSNYIHPDHHIILPHPTNADIIFVGNDGGIFVGNNITKAPIVFASRNKGYSPTQFYGIGASDIGNVIGGAQDNGTNFNNYTNSYGSYWKGVLGGDGFQCAISHVIPGLAFGTLYGDGGTDGGSEIHRSADGGKSFSSTMTDNNIKPETGFFLTRISLQEKLTSPTASKLFYATSGVTSMPGNVFVCNNPGSALPVWYKLNTNTLSDAYRMICTPDLNTVFVATENGQLYRFTGLNTAIYPPINYTSWNPTAAGITSKLIYTISNRFITGIAINKDHPDSIVLTMANYGAATNVVRISNALTTTGTATTVSTSIQGNLPAFPVYDVVLNPYQTKQAIVGTEYGVFTCPDIWAASPAWQEDHSGMPRVPTMQLVLAPDTIGRVYLFAGTHGRGAFYSKSLCGTCPDIVTNKGLFSDVPMVENGENNFSVYPNPFSNQFNITVPEKSEVKVYSISGQLVFYQKDISLKTVISTANWASGAYIVSVQSAGKTLSKKIVKE